MEVSAWGLFESANGGAVFLDEIGEMPLLMQVKLLRVLQEKEVVRVGNTKPIRVDVRVILLNAILKRAEQAVVVRMV